MFKSGDSPIPGYLLLQMLGRGEYGEVWEVEGPGGTHLAIKFIPLQDKKGQVELRSIQAVKLIRHANLVPIHAIWLLDTSGKVMESDSLGKAIAAATQNRADKTMVVGAPQFDQSVAYLVICMSLADGNLQDTLDEAIRAGKPGIPAPELLEYMRQAAIGLDFLNSPVHLVDGTKVGIQHRDVKPANLLVMANTVVIGDFGVATTLKEYDATGTSALGSMAFMAPESFSRRPSQASDQYALAITYYKLRSNHLPYDQHVSIGELIAIHNDGKLDFSKVPVQEQRVLAKATSTDPKSRFSSCKEFCDALIECQRESAPVKRSKASAIAASVSIAAIGLIAILLMDPLGWYSKPEPRTEPVVLKKNYVLTIMPANVTGTLAINNGVSEELINSIDLHSANNIELDGSELIKVQANSANPFLQSVDQTYTVDELAKQNWIISLPEISRDEWQAQIDQLLETGQWEEASRVYSIGARFDASLKTLPVPVIHEFEGLIDRFTIANKESLFAVSGHNPLGKVQPIILSIENEKLVPRPMPTAGEENSSIRSLYFTNKDKQLIVLREESIERWDLESDSVSTLIPPSSGSEPAHNWLGGEVSNDGKWLAVHDSADTIQVLNLMGEVNGRPFATSEPMNQQIRRLLFGGPNDAMTIVCDSLPMYQATIPQSSDSTLQVRALPSVASEAGDQVVVDAGILGRDATVVAKKNSVFVCRGDVSNPDNKFELLQELKGLTNSFLQTAGSGGWFLVGTDSDPSAYLWNLRDNKPALSIGTHEVTEIGEASFSSDGKWAAIVPLAKRAFKLIDLRSSSPQLIDFPNLDNAQVQHVGFTADSRYLIAVMNLPGSGRSTIYAWDFQRCWLALDARAVSPE